MSTDPGGQARASAGDPSAATYTFRVDADGTASFPHVSPACAELYGFTAAQAMADVRLMHDAIHPADRTSFDASGRESQRTGHPVCWEGRIIRADGQECRVVVTSRPCRLEDGSTQWQGQVVPLPVRDPDPEAPGPDHGAQRLARVHADALGMLGHDLGGPLTAILGSAELALDVLDRVDGSGRGELDDAILRRCLHVVMRQGARLDAMRRDLVTVAAADADAIVARPESVGVLAQLQAAADLPRQGIDVRIDCSPSVRCCAQATHLAQMLANLVSNADRYARSRITLAASVVGDRVHIEVGDDGPGIAPEMAGRLFTRFSHATATTPTQGAGTGLGLFIVRTLAHANHGTITCSPSDAGTLFTLALPAAEPAPPDPARRPPATGMLGGPIPRRDTRAPGRP